MKKVFGSKESGGRTCFDREITIFNRSGRGLIGSEFHVFLPIKTAFRRFGVRVCLVVSEKYFRSPLEEGHGNSSLPLEKSGCDTVGDDKMSVADILQLPNPPSESIAKIKLYDNFRDVLAAIFKQPFQKCHYVMSFFYYIRSI